jgi:Anti-sigma-28 factor, FlgM
MPKIRPQMIGKKPPRGGGKRDMRIIEIQQQIGRGEYHVDEHAVAEAIVRRLLQDRLAGSGHSRAQAECS